MAMSSTKARAMNKTVLSIAVAALLLSGLGGCVESRLRQSNDFGVAVRQDVAAQIADPDAQYRGNPAPASDGERAAVATTRYSHDAVTPPVAASTQTAVGSAGASAGGSR
jgi:hypothetical protein